MFLTKAKARALHDHDYPYPRGTSVKWDDLIFRRTGRFEIHHCCAPVGYDPQAGPSRCGRIAELIALTPEGVYALCERHGRLPERVTRQQFWHALLVILHIRPIDEPKQPAA